MCEENTEGSVRLMLRRQSDRQYRNGGLSVQQPKGDKVMMPKLQASHNGLGWFMVLAALCLVAYTTAYAQRDILDFFEGEGEDTVVEEVEPIPFLSLRNFRATPTFATDGPEDVDVPLISLTWTNPPDKVVEANIDGQVLYHVSLFRSTAGFPTGPLDGINIPVNPVSEAYLDREVQAGVTYYYTLVGDIPAGIPEEILDEYPIEILGEFPQVLHAVAVAGSEQPEILTAPYGYDPFLGTQEPFNLSYTQITFRPVGAPLAPLGEDATGASYTTYEATTTRSVRELPVKHTDAQGSAYTLTPLNKNDLLELPLGDMRFPFFGKTYDKIYVSINGYIVFQDFFATLDKYALDIEELLEEEEDEEGETESEYDIVELLDSPNLAGHFTLPRISFLYSLLQFGSGGQAWGRMLPDRMVVTFENAVELFYNPYSSPSRNTVQVELFFSGQIRFTYLESFVYYGVVGISDGRGTPVDPTSVFDDVEPAFGFTPFVHLPSTPSLLSINPVTPPIVNFGEDAAFMANTLTPAGLGLPFLTAQWTNAGSPPFADIGGGAGKFFWTTAYENIGAHTVRVLARSGEQEAYQDVRIVVRDKRVLPSAVNLLLSTDTPNEDPSVSRPIPPGRPLIASYVYYHPYAKESPLEYAEGLYMLYWFRNGQVVPSLTNSFQVPSYIPQPGERWNFQVIPITVSMIFGAPANSPTVTVLAVPVIELVTPPQGLTIGGDNVTIRGKYFSDLLSVKFDGVAATSIQVVGDNELRVVTPLHPAGKVAVTVETLGGVGRLVDAFEFVGDDEDPDPEEPVDPKVRRFLGCGAANVSGAGTSADMLLFGLVALALVYGSRHPRKSMSN